MTSVLNKSQAKRTDLRVTPKHSIHSLVESRTDIYKLSNIRKQLDLDLERTKTKTTSKQWPHALWLSVG